MPSRSRDRRPRSASQPSTQREPSKPQNRIDPASLRKVRAYNKYKRKLAKQEQRARTAIRFARQQIGKPYRWGATGPSAYDCSGLVMKAWRRAGVKIPRVTHSQYRSVRRKVSLRSLRPGDLIFFNGRRHVGMYVSKNRFVHAPNSGSRIRINKISRYRKRQFAGAVRPGAPAVKKWPDSIPRLSRQVEDMKNKEKQEAATEPAPAAPSTQNPSTQKPPNFGNDAPAQNSPVTSPQNVAPPGPSQDHPDPAPPGSSAPGSAGHEQEFPSAATTGRDPDESG
ncbi:C40 family peptidase [Actinomadura sp. 9N407]|uniref:C40 family peptidase n=1 Tax=Actinomadura sp. 9N407 TaxID=3375154 RepID=UPI0037A7F7CE